MGVTGIENAEDLAIAQAANVGKGLVSAGFFAFGKDDWRGGGSAEGEESEGKTEESKSEEKFGT